MGVVLVTRAEEAMLARSDQGKWIEGFCGILGASTPIQAELWGLRQGLCLAKEKNWTGILIESDCQDAVNLINGKDDVDNHMCRNLIEDCKRIKTELEPALIHVLREANRCADKMAKLGSTQNEKLVKILVPPMELVDDLIADLQGIAYPRGF